MRIIILLCAILLAACNPPKQLQPATDQEKLWQAQQRQLTKIQAWQLKGRIGIKTASDSVSAKLLWQQQPGAYHIAADTFFGQLGFVLRGNANMATLTMSNGESIQGATADKLMEYYLGWSLPLAYWQKWLLGMPFNPETARYALTEAGQLAELQEAGWSIQYQDYRLVNDIMLPHKLQFYSTDLAIKLLIQSWESDILCQYCQKEKQ